ncbi:MAG: bifunctional phosphopantothenoylcysteine decarboxylase/phosphopantothenate--cysteine ligase CoaBC [Ignavibacteriaceae bacterium]|nr:bifunctional phosphopantothenoylcysteine decarboxylase/phosphopantothenate--cysteine ligase CoaBC [Ignavibacteriaceae bacterium]
MNGRFSGKKIILGVTGCIAAYKSALILRELIKGGAEVQVVMTPSAARFIAPLTFSALSGREVITALFPEDSTAGTSQNTWHIDLALWADLMVIAPASVNTIAKIAHGFADNALTTLVTALRSPLMVVPTADVDMYNYKLTRENISKIESLGAYILEAEEGELASGLTGKGRLPEIEKITDAISLVLGGRKKDYAGKKVLVTAGPTFEDIDPVRFIGNRSSGKMGYALAKAAFLRGAGVTLISGPSSEVPYQEFNLIRTHSAAEMEAAVKEQIGKNDILIMSAAVADYRPAVKAGGKIKKEDKLESIQLAENPDILKSVSSFASTKVIVGFALETDNAEVNAAKKLESKNLDMIVLNSANKPGAGFEHSTNEGVIIKRNGEPVEIPMMSKFDVANIILDHAAGISK